MFPYQELSDYLHKINKVASRCTKNSVKLAERSVRTDSIKESLSDIYDERDIHFYGSRVMRLANHYSDVDIFIGRNGGLEGCSKERASREIMRLTDIMAHSLAHSNEWTILRRLETATVPVATFLHHSTMMKCDITFSAGVAVRNSHLVRHLFDLQPESRKLLHAVRIWLKIWQWKVKRYQLTLLVIFFLQQEGLMPSVAAVQRNLRKRFIGGWNVSFDQRRRYNINPMGNFREYLQLFFGFYASFNFDDYVIFPYRGTAVLKEKYEHQPQLKKFLGDHFHSFHWERPMGVASLLSMDYNVTYDVGKKRLQSFINICRESEEIVEEFNQY